MKRKRKNKIDWHADSTVTMVGIIVIILAFLAAIYLQYKTQC